MAIRFKITCPIENVNGMQNVDTIGDFTREKEPANFIKFEEGIIGINLIEYHKTENDCWNNSFEHKEIVFENVPFIKTIDQG